MPNQYQPLHGMSGTPTYISWCKMKQRCYYKPGHSYAGYGGRGITVCDEWHDFSTFLNDMGVRPEGKELDRIDTEKGYYKDNCRWATKRENTNNRRNTRRTNINGEVLTLMQISERYDIPVSCLNGRWRKGNRGSKLIRPYVKK